MGRETGGSLISGSESLPSALLPIETFSARTRGGEMVGIATNHLYRNLVKLNRAIRKKACRIIRWALFMGDLKKRRRSTKRFIFGRVRIIVGGVGEGKRAVPRCVLGASAQLPR